MKLSYDEHGQVTVLTMSGEFTTDQADTFRRTCQDRLEKGTTDIVIDMEHLTLIDSAGLESLLWLIEETSDRRGHLRLVNPSDVLQKIFEVTRLDRRFDIHDTLESAAKSLKRSA